MTKVKDRDAYIVIAPTGKSKIYSVAARRIGSKERYTVVATCTSDTVPQQIVDGLRLLQGEVLELSTVAERTLTDVRERLVIERGISVALQTKIRTLETEQREDIRNKNERIRELERQLVLAVPQPSLT